jgi:(1->4)-alpha-D-glucan 1-alpha-D-glucosylmutase
MADVFTHGDYEPLEVVGPHREHVIAFARRHHRDATIVAVGRSFAPFTNGGRTWLAPDKFDATILARGFTVEGIDERDNATELRVGNLFTHVPAAIVKAHAKDARIRSTRLQ